MVVTTYLRVPSSGLIFKRFKSFVETLSSAYGLDLVVPQLDSVSHLKEFCSDLIEGKKHPWRQIVSGLSSRSRLSIAHSLFLFRKVIPSSEPQVGAYVERMCRPQERADPDFVRFCRDRTRLLFRRGWDRSYLDKCSTSTLPLSACAEDGRKRGGCRGLDQSVRWDREDFCSYVSESVAPRHRGVSRVQAVEAGGKWRVISIPPRIENALRPFHQCLYDYVSRFDWCLRGDAKASSFSGFFRREGEVFVSGDYESATDNLNSEVQKAILTEIVDRSRSIPPGISSHALSTFDTLLEGGGVRGRQSRGQLMGQLLSFPLLCLVNYLTFKYHVRDDVPVRINGDDIVFRSTPGDFDRWSQGVNKSGLVLSAGKTSVSSRFFSLNSSVFDAGRSMVRSVPFCRPRAVWSSKEHMAEKISSLGSRFRSSAVGFGRERRSVFRTWFLRENRGTILSSRRSLTRGMGMKVTEGELRDSGLWSRELYYLEQVVEPPLPIWSYSQIRSNDCPQGWSRVSPHWYPKEVVKGWRYRFFFETVRLAWTNPVVTDSAAKKKWMNECMGGCSAWGESRLSALQRSLLGLSGRGAWRYLFIRDRRDVFGRCSFSRGRGVVKPGLDPSELIINEVVPAVDEEDDWVREPSDSPPAYSSLPLWGPPGVLLDDVRVSSDFVGDVACDIRGGPPPCY